MGVLCLEAWHTGLETLKPIYQSQLPCTNTSHAAYCCCLNKNWNYGVYTYLKPLLQLLRKCLHP
jgi:hypothetical protein